jgi:hypothetical protein
MSLAITISARLQKAFPSQALTFNIDSEPFLTIPPPWEGFGPITLHGDVDEVMVTIGTFTHTHIEGPTAEAIADQIVELLSDIFADRLVCWANQNSGGCHAKGEDFQAEDERPVGFRRALWSGPIGG